MEPEVVAEDEPKVEDAAKEPEAAGEVDVAALEAELAKMRARQEELEPLVKFARERKAAEAKAEAEAKKAAEEEARAKLTEQERFRLERDELAKRLEATTAQLQTERRRLAIREACKEEGIDHIELVEHLPAVTQAVQFDDDGNVVVETLAKALKGVKAKYGPLLSNAAEGSPGIIGVGGPAAVAPRNNGQAPLPRAFF